jgi:EAL domain-containing protein (putative c-di-GMP-specific phosphodiesterase class I)
LRQTSGRRRIDEMKDLSVNVYPESLLRASYFDLVQELVREPVVINSRLFLEISEKTVMPEVRPTDSLAERMGAKTFREILEGYVVKHGIGFVIDDFGVGHSSVSRLAQLHPDYIKIDQEILSHRTAFAAINFVVAFVNEMTSKMFLRKARIVVEGFDSTRPQGVTLRQLYDMGIEYIQGYTSGAASGDLQRLNQEIKNDILVLMEAKS